MTNLSPSPENPNPEQLFQENQGLVYSYLQKHPVYLEGYCSEDLIQEALMTIWEASLSYDPEKRTKFSTYVYTCLRNHFNNMIRQNIKQIRPTDSVETLAEQGRI